AYGSSAKPQEPNRNRDRLPRFQVMQTRFSGLRWRRTAEIGVRKGRQRCVQYCLSWQAKGCLGPVASSRHSHLGFLFRRTLKRVARGLRMWNTSPGDGYSSPQIPPNNISGSNADFRIGEI